MSVTAGDLCRFKMTHNLDMSRVLVMRDYKTGRYHKIRSVKDIEIDSITGEVVPGLYGDGYNYSIEEWRARKARAIACLLIAEEGVEI